MKKIAALTLLVSSLLMAEEAKNPLKTHAEFGFIDTKGNTDTQSYNLEVDLKKSLEKHSVEFKFDGQYAENEDEEIKNKYATTLEYNYNFMKTLAFTLLAGYKDDKFSGFDYQTYVGPGLKWNAYVAKTQTLDLEAAVLYSYDKYDTIQNGEDDNDYASGRAKLAYMLQMSENLKFTQDISYRVDLEDGKNYFVYSKTAFVSKFSDVFSGGISYKVDYANRPPIGKEYTDRTLTANLIADF